MSHDAVRCLWRTAARYRQAAERMVLPKSKATMARWADMIVSKAESDGCQCKWCKEYDATK